MNYDISLNQAQEEDWEAFMFFCDTPFSPLDTEIVPDGPMVWYGVEDTNQSLGNRKPTRRKLKPVSLEYAIAQLESQKGRAKLAECWANNSRAWREDAESNRT